MTAEQVRVQPPRTIPVVVTAAAFLLFFTVGGATAGVGAALPALHAVFGRGGGADGLPVSCYNAGALAAIITCAVRKRLVSARLELATSIGLFALGDIGVALAPTWPVLVGSLAVAGLGYGGSVVHVNSAFARGFGNRSILMINLVNASFGLGAVAGPFMVGLAGESHVRLVFLGIGVAALIAAPAYRCVDPAGPDHDGPRSSAARLPALRLIAPFLLLVFLYSGLETGIGAWEATYLSWIGLGPSASARWVSVYWLGISAGRFVVPLIAHRARAIILWGLLTATVALGIAVVPAVAPFAFLVAGIALGAVLPTVLAWLAVSMPAAQQATALVLGADLTGGVTHPLLIGAIVDASRAAAVPVTLACIGVLATLAARRTVHPSATTTS